MSSKVLVVIPTLNRPELCARAVQSVLMQNYKDWYVIVAMNGFPECLDEWEVKETQYQDAIGKLPLGKGHFMSYYAAGLGMTLNAVLEPALLGKHQQFDYWMNLEDDDVLDPEYLEIMVDALDSDPDVGVVNCLQRQFPREIQSNGGPMNAQRLQKTNWINWPECLWRREVYEKVGAIAEDVGPATDWDYHLRCIAAGVKYHHAEVALVTHHWHDGGKNNSPNYCLLVDGKQYIAKKRAAGAYD